MALWPSGRTRINDRDVTPKRWTYRRDADRWLFDASSPDPRLRTNRRSCAAADIIGTALALQTQIAKFSRAKSMPSGCCPRPSAHAGTKRGPANPSKRGLPARRMPLIPRFDRRAGAKRSRWTDSAQMSETMKALQYTICGAFRSPPWKAGLMERRTSEHGKRR